MLRRTFQKPWMQSIMMTVLVLVVSCTGCKKDKEITTIDPAQAMSINDYLKSLNPNLEDLLNIQGNGSLVPQDKQTGSATKNYPDGSNRYRCTEVTHSLTRNFDEVAIMRPTNGIVYPGALVKINPALMNGVPEPITLKRAPVRLRLDLPGIEDQGNIEVKSPDNSSVQTAIDKALNWWNNNKYQEGYVNASNTSYEATVSYSSEQLALDLGLSATWLSGSVSSQFSYNSSKEKRIAMAVFKQAFYTVTMETPDNPASVFGNGVTLADVQSAAGENIPPAYVSAVTYGRMIMFRMESSSEYTSTEVEAALRYGSGKLSATGDLASKYQKILQNSSITLVTIGGNAEAAAEGVSAKDFGDLEKIIKGKNALYSKDNPGVPIAYNVKSLANNSLVKMGFTTNYTAQECAYQRPGSFFIRSEAGYVARFGVSYKLDGKSYSKSSGDFSAGLNREVTVPAGATSIKLTVERVIWWPPTTWELSFTETFDKLEEKRCYKIWGTTLVPAHAYIKDCKF